MLVLSRHVGQGICIGGDVRVVVVSINAESGRVALGIDAPRGIPVHRDEIAARIQKEDEEHGRSA